MNVHFSSLRDNWSTPKILFNDLDAQFHFTIDVCANANNCKVSRYFDKQADGLSQSWSKERCFCNPPYGRAIKKWVEKAIFEVSCNNCDLVVMLLPARTDTLWFHDYILPFAKITFLRGRLHFDDCPSCAPFPSMICLFTSDLIGCVYGQENNH